MYSLKGMKLTILLFLITLTVNAQIHDSPARYYHRINEIRSEHRLKPLMVSRELELKATRWLDKMHVKFYDLHHDPYAKEAELLTNSSDPVTAWMRSKKHREILLSKKYKKIGIVNVEGDWCARLD